MYVYRYTYIYIYIHIYTYITLLFVLSFYINVVILIDKYSYSLCIFYMLYIYIHPTASDGGISPGLGGHLQAGVNLVLLVGLTSLIRWASGPDSMGIRLFFIRRKYAIIILSVFND